MQSEGGSMNNWHRKIWQLTAGSANKQFAEQVLNGAAGATNEFWLEPTVHVGPDVSVLAETFKENSLCYRVSYSEANMSAVWHDTILFPVGAKALTGLKPDKTPDR